MNIFVLDTDPVIAAQQMVDKHVVKMIVETAQILASVNHDHGNVVTYKQTHKNHPCTVWAGKSKSNYDWLQKHGVALCNEYTHRYGKTHKTEQYIVGELQSCPNSIPDVGLTEFAQAMPEQYENSDVTVAYKQYYIGEKSGFAKWTKRDIPKWFSNCEIK